MENKITYKNNPKHNLNVCVLSFAFCRPIELARSVLSIKNNYSTTNDYSHALIIDRAKRDSLNFEQNERTINLAYILQELGYVDCVIIRNKPFGTQKNIIHGISEFANRFKRLFVVEDDLELIYYHKDLSQIFFDEKLKGNVVAFTTYTHLTRNKRFSTFYSRRFSSQAWGIESDTWFTFDVENIKKLNLSRGLKKDLAKNLGSDMPKMAEAFQSGLVDSWAVPWNLHNFINGKLMIYPSQSYVLETGHKTGATRTSGIKFKSELATKFMDIKTMQPEGNPPDISYIRHFNLFNRSWRRLESTLQKVLTRNRRSYHTS